MYITIISILFPKVKNPTISCEEFNVRYLNRANLDLDRIRQASADLIGTHDFRNFCKLDIAKAEPTFIRRIDKITIEQLNIDHDLNSPNPG